MFRNDLPRAGIDGALNTQEGLGNRRIIDSNGEVFRFSLYSNGQPWDPRLQPLELRLCIGPRRNLEPLGLTASGWIPCLLLASLVRPRTGDSRR